MDEARYNLATRVMSNGVELIVADGKSTYPGEPNYFRILTNSKHQNRPLTLAPSTLNNAMMLLTLGGMIKGGKNPKVKSISPTFHVLTYALFMNMNRYGYEYLHIIKKFMSE
jgi:protein-L-isoaspartate O-methyltransferase